MITVKPGFSLIEIMIVITIIGVLMAGVFSGMKYIQRAKRTTTENKLATLDTELDTYATKVGEYPQDLHELATGPSNPKLSRKLGEPLVSEADLKDSWGREFEYSLNSKDSRSPYILYSRGSTGNSEIHSPRSKEAGA